MKIAIYFSLKCLHLEQSTINWFNNSVCIKRSVKHHSSSKSWIALTVLRRKNDWNIYSFLLNFTFFSSMVSTYINSMIQLFSILLNNIRILQFQTTSKNTLSTTLSFITRVNVRVLMIPYFDAASLHKNQIYLPWI